MEWKIEELPHLRGYTVEWAEDGDFILSRRNILYTTRLIDGPFTQFAAVDAPAWKKFVSRSRLAQRLLRFMVTNVVRLSNGELFVTFDKSVGVIRNGTYQSLNGL